MRAPDKNVNPASLVSGREKEISPLLLACLNLFHLKQVRRTGWLLPGRDIPIEQCESVAEHTFDMITLIILVSSKHDYDIQFNKLLVMIAIHDAGEIDDGDTPPGVMEREEKIRREMKCIQRIFGDILDSSILLEWIDEYHECQTLEARLAKALDYTQRVIQSWIYGKQFGKDLSVFMTNAKDRLVEFPELLALVEDLIKLQ